MSWYTIPCALLLALVGASCSPDESASGSADEAYWQSKPTRNGATVVRWRVRGGAIPLNEYFELQIELSEAEGGAPIKGAQVFVRCEMPAHGHGMTVEPRSREEQPGAYLVEGMLLHMAGDWVLAVDTVIDGVAQSAEFPLVLE